MADFNSDKAVSLQSIHISVSPAPAWVPPQEEVRALNPELSEGRTNPSNSVQATSQSGPSAPETAELTERFPSHLPLLQPNTMRQTEDSPRYNEADFFLHARPAHVSASTETAPQSLRTRSPTPSFVTGMHSGLNSTRIEEPLFGFSPSPPDLGAPSTTFDHDIFALDNTNPSWETPDLQQSSPHFPRSDFIPSYNPPSLHQPSPSSGRSTPMEFPSQPRTRLGIQDFIDLTADPTSPTMPAAASTRTPPQIHGSHEESFTPLHAPKRRKVQPLATANAASFEAKYEPEKIEEVDLRDVDDDTSLSKVLEQQRAETVKSQQNIGNQPLKLSSLQCIICMEPMTNITATYCGMSATLYLPFSAH